MSGTRKYTEKLRMLSQVKAPPSLNKKEITQKKKTKMIEELKAAAKSEIDITLVGSLEKLMQIDNDLDEVNEMTRIRILHEKYKGKEKAEEAVKQQDRKTLMSLYNRRNMIIKSIPKFWSTAFLSNYGLQMHLNEVDQKIIQYLNSVVVEDCIDGESGYTITLNFDENPYFENSSLTSKWSSSYKGLVHVSGTKIKWRKNAKNIATGPKGGVGSAQSRTDMHTSFFELFCDPPKEDRTKNLQVARGIKNSLWRFAPVYFNQAMKCM